MKIRKLRKRKNKVKKDRNTLGWKILVTLGMVLITQLLCQIPTPGINMDYYEALLESNGLLSMMNIFNGSSLSSMSVMALSVTPYITASIIVQLMEYVIPRLGELRKDGKTGEKKYKKITYITAFVLALLQGCLTAIAFGQQGLLTEFSPLWVILATATWCAGAAVVMFLGWVIDQKGLGNGISIILLTNILSSYPSDAYTVYTTLIAGNKLWKMILYGVIAVLALYLLFLFTTLIQSAERQVPVTYSGKLGGKQVHKIPLKLCPGGVIPVIFASTIMYTPVMVASFVGKDDFFLWKLLSSSEWFNPDDPVYSCGALIYVVLIFAFSYFYAGFVFNPVEVADNMKKAGAYINGVRPGEPTVTFIKKQMRGLIFRGAAGLSVIAIIPSIVGGVFGLSNLSFLGTSIIITVGVIIDVHKRIQTELSYKKPKKHKKRRKRV